MKQTILSGIRPTGKLHLGHLVGALANWVKLQEEYRCFFMAADWHALMGEYEDPSLMPGNIIDNVADWLSAGIDPSKSSVFIQSRGGQHLDLNMILSCLVPLGWLERCPTYKEQLREVNTRDLNTYGFLGYPVLQAADILLYKADKVPVGEDQLPHLELTREIARRFNSLYGCAVFPEPGALLTDSPRLPGLDGRKMSKSYGNAVYLSDDDAVVSAKVSSMVTDPARVRRSDKGHPEVCSVFSYYSVFWPEKARETADSCRNASIGCTECKKMLAAKLGGILSPLREKRAELLNRSGYIEDVLKEGAAKASAVAAATLEETRRAMKI
jgi:tryptophanyl-tRNA synthetase